MSKALTEDQKEILDELEHYYSDKLAAVKARRGGHGTPLGKRETVTSDPVRVHVNPKRKQIVLSWE
jgi:hypothetical protein